MKRVRRTIARTLVIGSILGAGILAIAMVMVLWSDPSFTRAPSISPEDLAASGISFEQTFPSQARRLRMADGIELHAQVVRPRTGDVRTTIVYVHGILGASLMLNTSSGMLAEAVHAEVLAVDLRGHGFSAGTPGDVDHVGQYEEDLADVITQLRAENPRRQLILAGHSMGGGIALRLAMNHALAQADGYLLLAPYLGWSSPTTRKDATDAEAAAEFTHIHLARILGLKLLNAIGITAFNGLRTQFFNLPEQLPLRSYSYRAGESMAPMDYRQALAAVEAPLLVVVGSADEAFVASAYADVLREGGHGVLETIDGATHNGLLRDARAMKVIATWVLSLRL